MKILKNIFTNCPKTLPNSTNINTDCLLSRNCNLRRNIATGSNTWNSAHTVVSDDVIMSVTVLRSYLAARYTTIKICYKAIRQLEIPVTATPDTVNKASFPVMLTKCVSLIKVS
jgi:hypothetical protein